MNGKPAYEQLIADKLQTLPVPDMADAIWARIQTQLDIDLPADDGSGGDNPAPQAPSGGSNLLGQIGLFIGIVALLTFFIINKKNKQENIQPSINIPASEIIQTDSVPPDKAPPANAIQMPLTPPTQNTITTPLPATPDSAFDNVIANTVMDSAVTDNTAVAQPPVATPLPAVIDSAPPKRRRGVPLSDADYRIVPKKDSLP
jgi:hypothetical protein